MKELKEACRVAYLAYVTSYNPATKRTCPNLEREYVQHVAAYVKAVKAQGKESYEQYTAWCAGAELSKDLSASMKEIESDMALRDA